MTTTKQPYISFHSNLTKDHADDTLLLSAFSGTEEISKLYELKLTLESTEDLLSSSAKLKIDGVLQQPATVTINESIITKVEGATRNFHGIISSIEQLDKVKNTYAYSAVLVPRMWRLKLSRQTRIFQGKTVPQIVEAILVNDYQLIKGEDFSITVVDNADRHPVRPFVVQYEETDFDFLCRWLEHEGIRFTFLQGETKEKIAFTDKEDAPPYKGTGKAAPAVDYHLGDTAKKETLKTLRRIQSRIPGTIVVKNATAGDVAGGANAEIVLQIPGGQGTVYLYENHYLHQAQGNAVATLRKEEFLCRKEQLSATSNVVFLSAGSKLKVSGHFNLPESQEYLLTSVTHAATQKFGTLITADYTDNTLLCIPIDATAPFRPLRVTPWPRIAGLVSGVIDGPANQAEPSYSPVDAAAAYKVRYGYDRDLKNPGNESAPTRMASPYAGDPRSPSTYGLHFPLHQGSEVVVGCLGGNPDQPVILGAVPNAGNTNGLGTVVNPVVKGENHTQSVLRTRGNNEIVLDDTADQQRVHLASPQNTTRIRLGKAVPDSRKSEELDPLDPEKKAADGLHIRTNGDLSEHVSGKFETKHLGNETTVVGTEEAEAKVKRTVNGDVNLEVTGTSRSEIGKEVKLINGFDAPSWDGYMGPKFSFLLGMPNLEIKTGIILELLLGLKVESIIGFHVELHRSMEVDWSKEYKFQKALKFVTQVKDKEEEAETDYVIKAGTSIKLVCGDSSITMKEGEILISSGKVTIQNVIPVAASNKAAELAHKAKLEAYEKSWAAFNSGKSKVKPALSTPPVKPPLLPPSPPLSTLKVETDITLKPSPAGQAKVGGQNIQTLP